MNLSIKIRYLVLIQSHQEVIYIWHNQFHCVHILCSKYFRTQIWECTSVKIHQGETVEASLVRGNSLLTFYGMVPPDLCRWRYKLCGCLGMWTMPYSASYHKWFPGTNATAHKMCERTSGRTCEHQSGISTIKIWQWYFEIGKRKIKSESGPAYSTKQWTPEAYSNNEW